MNKIFLTLVLSLFVSQIIKIIIFRIKHRAEFHLKDFLVTGGMPSTHSSLMTGLTMIIYLTEGFSSLFFLSLALTIIILRDATGVRKTAGEEGKIISQIIKKLKIKIHPFHYSLGHSGKEVLVGCFLGLMIALLVYYL